MVHGSETSLMGTAGAIPSKLGRRYFFPKKKNGMTFRILLKF